MNYEELRRFVLVLDEYTNWVPTSTNYGLYIHGVDSFVDTRSVWEKAGTSTNANTIFYVQPPELEEATDEEFESILFGSVMV